MPPSSTVPTFRDPAGSVIHKDGRILRLVPEAGEACANFLLTRKAQAWADEGAFVRTWRVSEPEISEEVGKDPVRVYEHERIPFPSFPYEWPAEMLYTAGVLTLRLALESLDEGYSLKDATPYNVLFRGARPVFVDALSFEPRQPGDSTWMPYAQFVRTFLLPLLAHRHFGLEPVASLLASRDGIEPEVVYRWSNWLQRLRPPFLSTVTLPNWLRKRQTKTAYRPQLTDPERADYVLRGLLESLSRSFVRVEPPEKGESRWSGYLSTTALYDARQFACKEEFVRDALAETAPRWVLDAGCNEGHFSAMAAARGASVVAIDSDAAVVGRTWRRAIEGGLDILPLVVDLSRPTPATGWRNAESPSFLDRARGRFDLVLGLAILHHLMVTERVPLDAALALFADLSSNYVLVEFIAPDDPMFQRIVRGREELYRHLTIATFEAALRPRFEVVRSTRIDGLYRWLYLLRKKDSRP